MRRKRFDEVRSTVSIIPDTCSFCEKKPIGVLTIYTLLKNRGVWVCSEHRRKWIHGDLRV